MSLHCESKVVGMDACTIILHADEVEATSFNLDGDTGATRIQGVLDELLDDLCRTFDDLPSGNESDGPIIKVIDPRTHVGSSKLDLSSYNASRARLGDSASRSRARRATSTFDGAGASNPKMDR